MVDSKPILITRICRFLHSQLILLYKFYVIFSLSYHMISTLQEPTRHVPRNFDRSSGSGGFHVSNVTPGGRPSDVAPGVLQRRV